MNPADLEKVVQLAAQLECVFIATCSATGRPHIAAAKKLTLTPDSHLMVTEWFRTQTINNLQSNSFLTLVVWDSEINTGYQILGEKEGQADMAMLDGYMGKDEENELGYPHVERQLLIHVDHISEFKLAPHKDS